MTVDQAKDIAALTAVIIAALSFGLTAFNSRVEARTSRARFWLYLRNQFAKHDEVHRHLRPGGRWADSTGPKTPEEWAKVEAHMGLFEHCEIMLSQRLIDENMFRDIYACRLRNIVANESIRTEKLMHRGRVGSIFWR